VEVLTERVRIWNGINGISLRIMGIILNVHNSEMS